ncbi:MAG TPA: fatty acyl-AMP ligase [Candidatus Angelobacter sp.]|nr:fatty acyl-AMP ligase [Candidatus Angelobacter sp.]
MAFRFLGDGETVTAEWSYKELDHQARIIGQCLAREGASGKRVLLLYPAGLEYISALFGCFYAGAVAVPAYPPRNNHNLERLRSIQEDCEPSLVLTTVAVQERLRLRNGQAQLGAAKVLVHETLKCEGDWQRKRDGNALALLQYTSASTGRPKGVKITHRNLLHNSAILKKAFCYTSASACVSWLPGYHDMGLVGGVLQPLFGGFPCTLLSPVHFLQRPIRWLEAISRFRATISGGPNFAYDLCVRRQHEEPLDRLDLSSWSVAFNGSEPVSAATMQRFAESFSSVGFSWNSFFPCYGLAEATLIVSGGPPGCGPMVQEINTEYLRQKRAFTQDERKRNLVPGSGQISNDMDVRIVDPAFLTPCHPGEVGEIWIRSESCGDGYWKAAEETKEIFHAHLIDSGEGPFLRSGDLGLLHQDQLFITGRIKDLIIIRGSNHYPQDIEGTVQRSHPAFAQRVGAAFGIESADGERLVVVQEIDRHRESEASEAIATAREEITKEHGLETYVVMVVRQGAVPRTTSGKIQRWAAKDAFRSKTLPYIAQSQINGQSSKETDYLIKMA